MRYGICTGLENLELLEELGFDYLEASVTAVMKLSQTEREECLARLRESKIKCEAFNVLFPKTMELIGRNSDKEALKDYLHSAFRVVAQLRRPEKTKMQKVNIPLEERTVVVFGSGKCRQCPEGYDYRQAYRELVEVYRITGEIAARYGIQIVIEPLSRKETNMICTMAEGAMLEADVNHPNVSLMSDYFHVIANHDNIQDIAAIGTFGHIHIAAGQGRRYPLDENGEQYSVFMSALKTIGYNGRISIEGKTEDIRRDGAKALALLKKLEESMSKVKLGIIGYGKMGSQHAQSLMRGMVSEAELTAVADPDSERLDAAVKLCGDQLKVFSGAEELIRSKTCEAVIISTPHYNHPAIAIMAMEAGIHVLVEKPAGVYTKQVEAMNRTARMHPDVVYCLDFNQRTNPLYQKMKELIESGELGQIKRTNWIITDWYRSQSYYDQGGWRATWDGEGGGVLLNQNPHNLDLWQWMCGMPLRVKANVYYGKHRAIEVEDDVTALVEYENGATGCYITTVGDAPGTNRLEVDGEKGKIVIEDDRMKFYRLRIPEPEFNADYRGGLGKPEVWECEIPVKGTYTSHPGILKNFCEAIQKGVRPVAPGEEGILGLQISNAIHLSSWTGGDWIELPVDEELFLSKLQERCKNPVT